MNRLTSNTFKYSNKTYTIMVSMYAYESDGKTRKITMSLDPVDIDEIVYESKLNDLLIKGHVTYTDKYAKVDQLLNQRYAYLEILFGLNADDNDNEVGLGKIDTENTFNHKFLVTNIKVIARAYSIIKYQVDFVSVNWFQCISNIKYSTYSKGPQPVFDIVKDCIASTGLKIHKDTFDSVKTDVKVNYITQLNDNLFSVVKYLLHKLYYFPDKDDSAKFLVYDWFEDEYRLLDLKDTSTIVGSHGTILSFFKSNAEMQIQQEATNIGALMHPMPLTDSYQTSFIENMYGYDFSQDAFQMHLTPSEQTVNYMNNKIDNGDYVQKYYPMTSTPGLDYTRYGSYWNNQYSVYNDIIESFEENNTFILNITGDIRRQPGSFTVISLDRTITALESESVEVLQKMKQKYRAYEGIWMASKVVNIISPSKQTFRQKLILFRNFIPSKAAEPQVNVMR